jgi:hypothetical protein
MSKNIKETCNCGCEETQKRYGTRDEEAYLENIDFWNEVADGIAQAANNLHASNSMKMDNNMQAFNPCQNQFKMHNPSANVTSDGANLDIANMIKKYVSDYTSGMDRITSLDDSSDVGEKTNLIAEILGLQSDLLVEKILRLSTQPCSEQEVKDLVSNFNSSISTKHQVNDMINDASPEHDSYLKSLVDKLADLNKKLEESETALMIYKVSGLCR